MRPHPNVMRVLTAFEDDAAEPPLIDWDSLAQGLDGLLVVSSA